MNPFVGRTLAAVGAVLGIVAIFVKVTDAGGKYWDSTHHVLGIVMLVLAILTGVGILLASTLGSRAVDQTWLIPALVLGGLFLWFPLEFMSSGNTGHLGVGSWLGLGALAAFVLAGILNAVPEVARATGRTAAPYVATAPATAPLAARTPEPAAASSPPADWYPDPAGQARLRYWDGNQWTDKTAP